MKVRSAPARPAHSPRHVPSCRLRVAQHVADRCAGPMAHTLAAALRHDGSGTELSLAARCSRQGTALRGFSGCAAQGDVWCLLKAAQAQSEQAAGACRQPVRRHRYAASRRLVQRAAAAVHGAAADWDTWMHGGASAALGSFVVLCTSAGLARAVQQLAGVQALVADVVAEEGGQELWALHELLQRQEQRLRLASSASA